MYNVFQGRKSINIKNGKCSPCTLNVYEKSVGKKQEPGNICTYFDCVDNESEA